MTKIFQVVIAGPVPICHCENDTTMVGKHILQLGPLLQRSTPMLYSQTPGLDTTSSMVLAVQSSGSPIPGVRLREPQGLPVAQHSKVPPVQHSRKDLQSAMCRAQECWDSTMGTGKDVWGPWPFRNWTVLLYHATYADSTCSDYINRAKPNSIEKGVKHKMPLKKSLIWY